MQDFTNHDDPYFKAEYITFQQGRPSVDEYFLEIAKIVSRRSTCLRRTIGAVLVKDKRILSTGYNGAPSGMDHCDKIGCARYDVTSGTQHEICRAVHAEQNAIIQAALHGVSTEGSTLYCTHKPCSMCAKMLINAKIVRVVYEKEYEDRNTLTLFEEAGVDVCCWMR